MKTDKWLRLLQLVGLAGLLVALGCESASEHPSDSVGGGAASGETETVNDAGESTPAGENQSDIPPDWKWVFGPDVSNWPVTINLYGATVRRGAPGHEHLVQVNYSDRLRQIPAWNVPGDPKNVHNVNGTIWLIREYQGQWYIGTIDYLRVGQTSKYFAESPAYYFTPKPGDKVGFMVGTVSREWDGTRSGGQVYRERSNITWVTW